MNDMNVIRPGIASVQPAVIGKAEAVANGDAKVNQPGNNLPSESQTAEAKVNVSSIEDVKNVENKKAAEEAKAEKLKDAVDRVNDFVQNVQRDLHFSVDDDTEKTVVKVVESSSGEVIRQIPDETFLELARKMKEFGDVQLVNAQG